MIHGSSAARARARSVRRAARRGLPRGRTVCVAPAACRRARSGRVQRCAAGVRASGAGSSRALTLAPLMWPAHLEVGVVSREELERQDSMTMLDLGLLRGRAVTTEVHVRAPRELDELVEGRRVALPALLEQRPVCPA